MYIQTTLLVILISAACTSQHKNSETSFKKEDQQFSDIDNNFYRFTEQNQPHVLFILADDLGFNDVSYNGKQQGSAISTPNIDRLAAEGVILGNYYVQPLCTPTRAQLLTGRYTIRYGLQHSAFYTTRPSCLPVEEVTLAEKLREAGYTTHAVGKWHLGFYKEECLPTKRGFDSFFGSYDGIGYHFNHSALNGGYDLHRDTEQISKAAWRQKGQYSTTVFTREAQNVIRQHAKSKQPFFLYLAYTAPHDPYEVPEHYKKPYEHLILDKDRQTLAGMISFLDESIGNVTKTLKDASLYENTIIVFSTDNGGAQFYSIGDTVVPQGNNWPLRGCKNTLWEGGIHGVGFVHSPLLPNNIKGTTSQAFIHVSDWFPTIVSSIAGGSLNGTKPLDGYDVWDSITANMPSQRTELLHNIDPLPPTFNTSDSGRAALRMGDWKLIVGDPGITHSWVPPSESGLPAIDPVEPPVGLWLFNIAKDPSEKLNLAYKRLGIVKRMLERLNVYNQSMVPPIYPDLDSDDGDPSIQNGVLGPWE